jgi:excisionase family DNA binding protein
MTVDRDALRSIALSLPAGSAVPVPREWLLDLLDGSGGEAPAGPDYTVAEVAARFGRATSTVRTWILAGELRAYRLRGREHRITPQALQEFEARQRTVKPEDTGQHVGRLRPRGRAVDLGAYRNAS